MARPRYEETSYKKATVCTFSPFSQYRKKGRREKWQKRPAASWILAWSEGRSDMSFLHRREWEVSQNHCQRKMDRDYNEFLTKQ